MTWNPFYPYSSQPEPEKTQNINSSDQQSKLVDKTAPHEPAGILRGFRAGLVGKDLVAATGMKGQQAVDSLRIAMEEEETARAQGRKIHDATMTTAQAKTYK